MPYSTNPTTGAQVWEGSVLPAVTQKTIRATLADHETRIDTLEADSITGVTVDNRILRGDGTSGAQSSAWSIDDDGQASVTVDGENEIGLAVTTSGVGATGVLGYATGGTSFGIHGAATVSGSTGVRASQLHASAIAFQMRNIGTYTASFSFAGTADRAIIFPDSAGTIALMSNTEPFSATVTPGETVGVLGSAAGSAGAGVQGIGAAANAIGVRASAGVSGAIPLQIETYDGFRTSITSSAAADRSVSVPDISGALPVIVSAPATATSEGTAGSIAYDANYIYVCTAADTWKRGTIAGW